jgi:Na+-translocating ferredoxin:NAD+ oxidoreductase RnfG subunit
MSFSAPGGRRWRPAIAVLAAVLALSLPCTGAAVAQVRLTQQEALRLAFPEPATFERRTVFLTQEQLERARDLAGSDVRIDHSVVTYYVGFEGEIPVGVAYFDAHLVRTLPEVLMFVVSPDASIERIEILKFTEPPEYEAPDSWMEQFEGQQLTDDLSLKGSVINMTGATLTSQAVTRASRRVLALHQIIGPLGPRGSEEDGP